MRLQIQDEMKQLKSVYVLNREQIDFYWDQIRDGFGEVPQFYDFFTPEYVYERIKMGHYQVWALSDGAIKGIVLTQILCFPKQNVFEVLGAYGIEMIHFYSELQDVFLRFARQNGCDTMYSRCRPGVARLLRKFHPKTEFITLSYPVPEIEEQS